MIERSFRSNVSESARSILLTTSRSASATCFIASGKRPRLATPFTASTTVTTFPSRKCQRSAGSEVNPATIGTGSARPVVSITTRSNGGTAPLSIRPCSRSSPSRRSPRIEQQTQPLLSSTTCSSTSSTSRWSSPTSPNSLISTAVPERSGSARSRLSREVLPLPRKPVRRCAVTVRHSRIIGQGAPAGRSRPGPKDRSPVRRASPPPATMRPDGRPPCCVRCARRP